MSSLEYCPRCDGCGWYEGGRSLAGLGVLMRTWVDGIHSFVEKQSEYKRRVETTPNREEVLVTGAQGAD